MTEKEKAIKELRAQFSSKIHEIGDVDSDNKKTASLDGGQSGFEEITKWFYQELEKINIKYGE